MQFNKYTYIHTYVISIIDPPREDQCEWHRLTRMTGPDCVVMCNLINTYIHTYIHTYIREPIFATPCCNTSRATWSTPSEPPHRKPFFWKSCGFRLCLVQTAVLNLFVLYLVLFISVCPCIPETGRLENTYSCCGVWLWPWLAVVVNLFVLNLLCFISVCLYPKRADCRTRTYREETKKTLPRRPGHVAPRGAFFLQVC